MSDRVICVTGLPRSGTSFLAACINWHPQVGPRHQGMFDFASARSFVNNFYRLRYTQFIENNAAWSPQSGPTATFGTRQPQPVKGFSKPAALRQMVSEERRPVYLSKSPGHIWRLEALRPTFPRLKVLIILRQFEAIIGSVYQHRSHLCPADLLSEAGIDWLGSRLDSAVEQIERMIGEDCLVVSYEDLVQFPTVVLSRVVAFCGLEPKRYIKTIRPRDRRLAWRDRIPIEHHAVVEAIAMPLNHRIAALLE